MSKEQILTLLERQRRLTQFSNDIAVGSPRGEELETTDFNIERILLLANLRESLAEVFLPGLSKRIAELEFEEKAAEIVEAYFAEVEKRQTQLNELRVHFEAGSISNTTYEAFEQRFNTFQTESKASPELKAALDIYTAQQNTTTDTEVSEPVTVADEEIKEEKNSITDSDELIRQDTDVENSKDSASTELNQDLATHLEFLNKTRMFVSKLLAYFASHNQTGLSKADMVKVTENVISTDGSLNVALVRFRKNLVDLGLELKNIGDRTGGIYKLNATNGVDLEERLGLIRDYIQVNGLDITYNVEYLNDADQVKTSTDENDTKDTIEQSDVPAGVDQSNTSTELLTEDAINQLFASNYRIIDAITILMDQGTISTEELKILLGQDQYLKIFTRTLKKFLKPLHIELRGGAREGTTDYSLEAEAGYDLEAIFSELRQSLIIEEGSDNTELSVEDGEDDLVETKKTPEQDYNLRFLKKPKSFNSKILKFYVDNPDARIIAPEIQEITEHVLTTASSTEGGIKKFRVFISRIGLKLESVGKRAGKVEYSLQAAEGNSREVIYEKIRDYLDQNKLIISYKELSAEEAPVDDSSDEDTPNDTENTEKVQSSLFSEPEKPLPSEIFDSAMLAELEENGITKELIAHISAILLQSQESIAALYNTSSDLKKAIEFINICVQRNNIRLETISLDERRESLQKVIQLVEAQVSESDSFLHKMFREDHPALYFIYLPYEMEEILKDSGEAAYGGELSDSDQTKYKTRLAKYIDDWACQRKYIAQEGVVLSRSEITEIKIPQDITEISNRLDALRNSPKSVEVPVAIEEVIVTDVPEISVDPEELIETTGVTETDEVFQEDENQIEESDLENAGNQEKTPEKFTALEIKVIKTLNTVLSQLGKTLKKLDRDKVYTPQEIVNTPGLGNATTLIVDHFQKDIPGTYKHISSTESYYKFEAYLFLLVAIKGKILINGQATGKDVFKAIITYLNSLS